MRAATASPAFDRDATRVTYHRRHGQRLLDRLGVPAAYPLGLGLSYTSWDRGPTVGAGDTLAVTVRGSLRPASTWHPSRRDVVAAPGPMRVDVAGYSGDPAAMAIQVVLH